MANWLTSVLSWIQSRRTTKVVTSDPFHVLCYGTTGVGKSTLLDMMRSRDASEGRESHFVEVIDTPQQTQQRQAQIEFDRINEDARLGRLRQAIWEDLEADPRGGDHIDYCLNKMFGIRDVMPRHRREVVFLLDRQMLGGVAAWGADDTEVRAQLCEWFEENDLVVRSTLASIRV